jgi:protease PrsW
MPYIFIALGLIPSFAWLFFFLKEDVHPEPKKMIALVFFFGALSTFFALGFQFALRAVLSSIQIGQYDIWAFLGFGFIEEVLKFSAVYLVVKKSKFFDEPIDAMIYMITAALGFALVENIAIMSNVKALSEAFNVITLRFVGATLLHALSSGIVGYYWARALLKIRNLKLEIFVGLVLATLLHAIFNHLIMVSREIIIYPTIFLIIAALFVFWDFEKIKSHG